MNKKQREDYPIFNLDRADSWLDDQCFVDCHEAWLVDNLWAAAKNLPAYEVPLVALDLDLTPWDEVGDSFLEFCSHVKLVNEADLDYPIILTPKGAIADGRHRLAKAIVEGCTTIKIKRLVTMPEPDFEFDGEGNTIGGIDGRSGKIS